MTLAPEPVGKPARPRRSPDHSRPGPDDEQPLANAWPGGLRTIACLWCNRPFASAGRQERMCPACRRHAL
jgi:hypothetical protein